MSFMRLTSLKQTKNTGPITKLYKQVLRDEITEQSDPLRLRPSSFPLCPIHVVHQHSQHEQLGYVPHAATLHSDFFTSVGTALHLVFQKWFARTGVLFGNWKCTNSKCRKHGELITMTTQHLCSRCDYPLEYCEIEVDFYGVVGHVDGVVLVDTDTYVVLDFKTTSSNVLAGKKLPKHENIKQLSSYAYILRKKYQLNVVGHSLLYVVRDNPGMYGEFYTDFGLEQRQQARDFLRSQIKMYRAAITSLETHDAQLVVDHKPCPNETYYHENMHVYQQCPFLDVCFNPKKLLRTVQKFVQE